MSKVVVIADDLTGANATGVLISKHGYKVATFSSLEKYNNKEHNEFNAVLISTDSRAVEKEKAYDRVKKVIDYFKHDDVALFCKRIDSTLRGNIGAEIFAVLNNATDDLCAVIVPAFPSSGRICVGGYLLVNQVPLEKTEIALDLKTPILTSKVIDILKKQINEEIGYIDLNDVLHGIETIKERLIEITNNKCRFIMVDAATNDDIYMIAEAVKQSKLKVLSVDPGPFTAALTKEYLYINKEQSKYNIMLTIGSVSNLTKKQINEFKSSYLPLLAEVDAERLINDDTRNDEINKAVNMLTTEILNYNVLVATTNYDYRNVNLKQAANTLGITEEEVSIRINDGLAQITVNVLKKSNAIKGLYTSGGDVTVSVCNSLGAAGIRIKNEIIPLAVYGSLIGGDYNDMPIVTKGGLVGDEKALIKCVDYLLTRIKQEKRCEHA